MTNAEWAIENMPELFVMFDCSKCDSRGGDRCLEPGGCAKGHVEWLLMPHESASDGDAAPVTVSDECEPVESENAASTDADSREKLEADARKVQERIWDAGARYDGIGLCHIIELLDRQAAITKHETVTECDRLRKANGTLCQSLMDAEHERDELKERIAELQERKCPGYDPDRHYCCWHDADFELNADRLNDLRRENAKLKKQVDELNHAESAAETHELAENPQKTPEQGTEIPRICDTCRWFGGSDDGYLGECYRYPSVVDKMPDDRCGEWAR